MSSKDSSTISMLSGDRRHALLFSSSCRAWEEMITEDDDDSIPHQDQQQAGAQKQGKGTWTASFKAVRLPVGRTTGAEATRPPNTSNTSKPGYLAALKQAGGKMKQAVTSGVSSLDHMIESSLFDEGQEPLHPPPAPTGSGSVAPHSEEPRQELPRHESSVSSFLKTGLRMLTTDHGVSDEESEDEAAVGTTSRAPRGQPEIIQEIRYVRLLILWRHPLVILGW
jgi:hypothetical protein